MHSTWRNDPRRPGMQLGQQRQITIGGRQLILDLAQASEAETVTISLGIESAPASGQGGAGAEIDTPIYGLLAYGVGAYVEQVEVDWINGTLLTVPAGNVRLEAVYPAVVGASGWDLKVGAHATLGTRGGGSGSFSLARRTQRWGALTTGAKPRQNVPARGHAVRLLVDDPAAYGNVELAFCRSPALGGTVPERVLYRVTPSGPEAIPLTTGIRSIALDLTVAADVTLLFDLAL